MKPIDESPQLEGPSLLKPIVIGAGTAFIAYVLIAWLLVKTVLQVPWLGRVLSDDFHINAATYIAFGIAMAIVIVRQRRIRKQMTAFASDFLSPDEQSLLLPEDGQNLRKRFAALDSESRKQVPFQLLDAALQRSRANWSAPDASEAVKTRADLMQAQVDSEFALVRYLAWAIPSIGFIGTVLGLGLAIGTLKDSSPGGTGPASESPMAAAAGHLYTAFDTTLVALVLSLVLMYYLHMVQAAEDALIIRSSDWCLRRFVFRMHATKE